VFSRIIVKRHAVYIIEAVELSGASATNKGLLCWSESRSSLGGKRKCSGFLLGIITHPTSVYVIDAPAVM